MSNAATKNAQTAAASPQASAPTRAKPDVGQIVLVFQGGGALGAYQIGVYEALHEAGIEPDWVIGTSIGAINAALIAGNPVAERLARIEEFWKRVSLARPTDFLAGLPGVGGLMANLSTVVSGLPNFFEPNPLAFMSSLLPLGPERAGYYSTRPLRETLGDLIDIDRLNANSPRLTVGAANISTGEMHYFDSRDERLGFEHVMASGALPPAFPAVRIDGQLYWDGGILSNTPIEAVFDDRPRLNSLVLSVQIWGPHGREPSTIAEVLSRQKDVQFASRTLSQVARQQQMHRLRHIIMELSEHVPAADLKTERLKMLKSYGCMTRMHVVRLNAPHIEGEDQSKDIDFSSSGIRQRREAGRTDMLRVLERQPWIGEFDPIEGFVLHEVVDGAILPSD